tara:strand:+ start:315 stop:536 length:222 start_codon:yes stop_codon:yes gene_type:complete
MTDQPPVQTHVRKILIGTPVKKVVGAAAQSIGDLTDVDTSGLTNDGILQFNIATGKFEVTTLPQTLTFSGGSF